MCFIQTNSEKCLVGHGPFKKAHQPASEKISFYLPDFFLSDPRPWWIPSQTEIIPVKELALPCFGKIDWSPPLKETFNRDFAGMRRLIAEGKLKKGVPVFFETGDRGIDRVSAQAPPESPDENFLYGFLDDNSGMAGCTPEVLFKIDGHTIRTMALAGTKESGSPEKKLRLEHRWVVEDVVTQLKLFGSPQVGESLTVSTGGLTHLKTGITVTAARTPDFSEMIRALHPTSALGTFPRDPEMKWLKRQSPVRGRFGAPFGVRFPDGRAFCLVAIRNVMWEKNRVQIGSGVGIIGLSDPEEEWEELRLKREAVKRMFCQRPPT